MTTIMTTIITMTIGHDHSHGRKKRGKKKT
jgi:hypothetical protein